MEVVWTTRFTAMKPDNKTIQYMKYNYQISICLALICFAATQLNAQCGFAVSAGQDVYVCGQPGPVQIQFNGEVFGDVAQTQWLKGTKLMAINDPSPVLEVSETTKFTFTGFGPGLNNMIVNGNFDQGNTGFTSEYSYAPGYWGALGTYDILANPETYHVPACEESSPSGGNMYLGMGSEDSYQCAWSQTVPVQPNTFYYFSFWATSHFANTPTVVQAAINGLSIAAIFLNDPCEWYQTDYIWDSKNNTSATICIRRGYCLDPSFLLDDIFMSPMCIARDTV